MTAVDAQSTHPFPRLNLVGTLGQASGAGNRFTDVALAGGLRIGQVEGRVRWGTLVFFGGCAAEVPTKCSAGDGPYLDAMVSWHFAQTATPVGSWTVSVGPGFLRTGQRPFLGVAVGHDLGIGRRGLARIELYGRHLFDPDYRRDWGESHRQVGVRVGIGLWTAVERL